MTTILDPRQASKEELADLYRMRWNNETDLSSLKVTLQMDQLDLLGEAGGRSAVGNEQDIGESTTDRFPGDETDEGES